MPTTSTVLLSVTLILASLLAVPGSVEGAGRHQEYYLASHRAFRIENWGEALIWLDRAIRVNPRPGGQVNISGRNFEPYLPYYRRGIVFFELGVFDNAFRDWQRADALWAELFPRHQDSFEELRADIARRKSAFLEGGRREADRYLALIGEELALAEAEARGSRFGERFLEALGCVRQRSPELRREVTRALEQSDFEGLTAVRRDLDALLGYVQKVRSRIDLDDPARPEGCGSIRAESVSPGALVPAPKLAVLDAGTSTGPRLLRARPAGEPMPVRMAAQALPPEGRPVSREYRDADLAKIRHETYGSRHALLVAFRSYSEWAPLDKVGRKLPSLARALEDNGFDTVEVIDESTVPGCSGRGTLKERVEECIRGFFDTHARVGAARNLLLLHIVGHGHTACVDGASIGMVLLPGAPLPPADLSARCDSSVPPSQWDYVAAMQSQALATDFFRQFQGKAPHQILLTVESCFSGSFVEGLGVWSPVPWNVARTNPAFTVLTVGGANETGDASLPLTTELTAVLDGCRGSGYVVLGYDLAAYLSQRIRVLTNLGNSPQPVKYKRATFLNGDVLIEVGGNCSSGL